MAEVYNGAYSGLGESSNLQNDDFYAIFRFLPLVVVQKIKKYFLFFRVSSIAKK